MNAHDVRSAGFSNWEVVGPKLIFLVHLVQHEKIYFVKLMDTFLVDEWKLDQDAVAAEVVLKAYIVDLFAVDIELSFEEQFGSFDCLKWMDMLPVDL